MIHSLVFYRNNEPTIHTQPSIVRIEDGDDSSSSENESESEDSILIKTDMVPSPMESNVSVRKLQVIIHNSIFVL